MFELPGRPRGSPREGRRRASSWPRGDDSCVLASRTEASPSPTGGGTLMGLTRFMLSLLFPLAPIYVGFDLDYVVQYSRSKRPAPISGDENPVSLKAYQKVTTLMPRIGMPIIGSSFSETSIMLMFVPH